MQYQFSQVSVSDELNSFQNSLERAQGFNNLLFRDTGNKDPCLQCQSISIIGKCPSTPCSQISGFDLLMLSKDKVSASSSSTNHAVTSSANLNSKKSYSSCASQSLHRALGETAKLRSLEPHSLSSDSLSEKVEKPQTRYVDKEPAESISENPNPSKTSSQKKLKKRIKLNRIKSKFGLNHSSSFEKAESSDLNLQKLSKSENARSPSQLSDSYQAYSQESPNFHLQDLSKSGNVRSSSQQSDSCEAYSQGSPSLHLQNLSKYENARSPSQQSDYDGVHRQENPNSNQMIRVDKTRIDLQSFDLAEIVLRKREQVKYSPGQKRLYQIIKRQVASSGRRDEKPSQRIQSDLTSRNHRHEESSQRIKRELASWSPHYDRSEKEKSQESPNCLICLELAVKKPFIILQNCSDIFHFECLEKELHIRIDEKSFPIYCPQCRKDLNPDDTKNTLQTPLKYQIKFEMFSLQAYIDKHPQDFDRCITPDCNYAYLKNPDQKRFDCPNCKRDYCKICKETWNYEHSCRTLKRKQGNNVNKNTGRESLYDFGNIIPTRTQGRLEFERQDFSQDFKLYVEKWGFKTCPNCSMMVERNGGCPHMICLCGSEFCYLTGKIYQQCNCGAH